MSKEQWNDIRILKRYPERLHWNDIHINCSIEKNYARQFVLYMALAVPVQHKMRSTFGEDPAIS